MQVYRYDQNNSGGHFDRDPPSDRAGCVHERVYVEAANPWEADVRAEARGVYFDGVARGHDCACCGDRWRRADDFFNALKPDEPLVGPAWLHYADGTRAFVYGEGDS